MLYLHCFVLGTMCFYSIRSRLLYCKDVSQCLWVPPPRSTSECSACCILPPHTIWPNLYTFTVRRRMSVSLRLITTSIGRTTGLTGRHLDLFNGWPLLLGPLVLVLGRAPFFLLFVVTTTVVAAA